MGRSLLAGLAIGLLVAGFLCYVAVDHNPQGEFADPVTGVYTTNLYLLFAMWTGFAGFPAATFLAFIGYLQRRGD